MAKRFRVDIVQKHTNRHQKGKWHKNPRFGTLASSQYAKDIFYQDSTSKNRFTFNKPVTSIEIQDVIFLDSDEENLL